MREMIVRVFAQSKQYAILAGFLLVAIVGMTDYATGTEVSFSIFYLIPISIVAWHAGQRAGLMTAVVSALSWLLVDLAGGRPYSQPFIPYWNALVRLGFFLIVVLLLTTHQRASAALRRSEEKFRLLIETAVDAMVIVNGKHDIVLINSQAERLFGYRREELIGQPVELLIPERFREQHRAHKAAFFAGPRVRPMAADREFYARHKDGTEFPVDIGLSPLETEEGILATAIVRDLTARRRAEEAIARLAAIVESSDDAIIGKTLDGVIVTWNAGAERVYGYPAAEVVGKPVSILVPPDHQHEVPEILERIKRRERGERFETVRMRKDGERIHISLTISPIKDAKGNITGASSIARDITRRKKTEAALRQLHQELEAFTYSVSHDLRAPLRHVDGFAKILAEEFGSRLAERGQHLLHRIQHGTTQMTELIDDLLALSRAGRQRLALHRTSLHTVVEEVHAELKPEWDGRKIECHIDPLPTVDCDPGLMKQVFFNLLSNALKFTRPREDAVVHVGQAVRNGETVIFVRDNGVGFDMQYAHKLFGVFQRLHRQEEFEGTGVGLALVQRIIHRHGGCIWAEAEPGKGAIFSFTLGAPVRDVLPIDITTEGGPW